VETTLNDDQAMLAKSAREFLAKSAPLESLAGNESTPTQYNQNLWAQMAKLGWTGLLVPTELGGSGGSHADLELLCEEMGRVLLPPPFVAVSVATAALEMSNNALAHDILSGISEGMSIPVLAVSEGSGSWNEPLKTVWNGSDVTGSKAFVEGGCAANWLIVAGREKVSNETRLIAVNASEPNVVVSPQDGMTNGIWAQLVFDHAYGVDLELPPEAIDRALMRAAIAMAGWCAGAASRLLEDSVTYVSDRFQFGVPIGSFQAIQHSLADCCIAATETETLARWAAETADEGVLDSRRLASTAFVRGTRALVEVSRRCHQAWGGMGYSTEAHVHHFSRRAKMAQHSWGGTGYHLAVIAEELRVSEILRDRYLNSELNPYLSVQLSGEQNAL
jgi:alkylation response protein AidB-like acyl-CoA dehydrogenase